MAMRISIKGVFSDGFTVIEGRDNHATARGDLRVLNNQARGAVCLP